MECHRIQEHHASDFIRATLLNLPGCQLEPVLSAVEACSVQQTTRPSAARGVPLLACPAVLYSIIRERCAAYGTTDAEATYLGPRPNRSRR